MVESLRAIAAIPELRNRVLFTLGMLAVFRLGSHIPTPGVNTEALRVFAEQAKDTMFGLYDMFSGGNLANATIFALGVMPYISASIIIQLLTIVWPYLERLSKEGELGRRKITQYTRYSTIALSLVQAAAYAYTLEQQSNTLGGLPIVANPGIGFLLTTMLTMTTGSVFVMWLGEQITERGIGNGMSLIIFAGIVSSLPTTVLLTLDQLKTGQIGIIRLAFILALMVAVVAAVIFVERGHRRVTVQYAKRLVGKRVAGGTSTHIPLKVNTGGVIPVIFASSLLAFPATLAGLTAPDSWVRSLTDALNYGQPLYMLIFVSVMPIILFSGLKLDGIPWIGEALNAGVPEFLRDGLGIQFAFGGTSILIVVGVAMDTVQQIESQLIMRHYDSFMKKTRIRGRRG
jgi:preprotein translocase subunit SecY